MPVEQAGVLHSSAILERERERDSKLKQPRRRRGFSAIKRHGICDTLTKSVPRSPVACELRTRRGGYGSTGN
jgi:hypothetical protein